MRTSVLESPSKVPKDNDGKDECSEKEGDGNDSFKIIERRFKEVIISYRIQ